MIRVPNKSDSPWTQPNANHWLHITWSITSVLNKLVYISADKPCERNMTGDVVKSWKWRDDKTLDMTLHQGIKFHNKPPTNGREMTAEDVAYSWTTFTDPLFAGGVGAVDSVEVTGRYTFTFHLNRPFGGFILEVLANGNSLGVLPREYADQEVNWGDPTKSWVGTGPFTFDDWRPGVSFTQVRNPNYWRGPGPYIDAVRNLIIPDTSTRLAAIRSGKTDVDVMVPWPQLDALLSSNPELKLQTCPGIGGEGIYGLWMRNDKPPFDDLRVRRAAAMAIDQQSLINVLWDGKAQQVPVMTKDTPYALTPDDFPPEVARYRKFHPDEAKRLLAEAGYTPQSPPEFQITVTPRYPSPYMEQAEAIVSMLNKVGFRARLNVLEYGAYLEQVARKQTYPAGMAISRVTYPSPEAPFALFSFHSTWGGSANRSIVRDPEMDRMIETFSMSSDEAERQRLAREIQIRAVDQAYRVPLPAPVETIVLQPWVKDFYFKAYFRHIGDALEKAWIDK